MTRRIAVALLPLVFVLPAVAADKSPLEGKWTVTSLTRDGKVDKSLDGATREHAGEKYSVTPPAGSHWGKARIMATVMNPAAGS